MLDTLNPNTPKANPQTAMQGIEISEQTAENLTPNQNKTADELLQNRKQLQESQTTPQTNPTLAQGVEQILDDNTYPTPKQENSAGIEISEQAAENLSKSKDIEARANALIHNTYANLKAQLDNRQGILQAIREQMPQPNNEAQALQAIREQSLREQAIREKGTLLESISEQAREQNLPKVFNKIENHPLLARIKEQMPTTQQATHLPQTPQQIEQLANDLTQLSREYPQVFKGYTPQLKEVLRNNTDTLFKNGALNKDNFRALLERIDAEITPKVTEPISVVKKNLTTENKQLKSDLKDDLSIENITLPPTPSAKGYDLDRTLSGEYDKVIIPQNAEQFYNLHNRVLDLKSALKEVSTDQANNNQWFEKWGEDVNKAYSRHKELAQKLNNTPQSFDDFSAEFQDLLQKHTQAKTRNAAKIQDLQKQIEQTQKAIDDFKIQGYENVDGYFLPTDYKNSSDFIAKIGDLGESNKYALFNALKSKDFETGISQFLESFSKTHTKEQTQKIKQTLTEAKSFYDSLKKKDLDSFYNSAKRQTQSSLQAQNDIHYKQEPTTKSLLERIKENRVFGKNYPQFYHKGQEAIGHLLQKRSGQVKGAFHKEGIGDIDLVWGDDKIGLQKIITKHSNDFASFGDGQKGIINGLSEIIKQGKVFEKNNVKTI